MKNASFKSKTNTRIRKRNTIQKRPREGQAESFGAGVGPLKVWLKSQHPFKLACIAVWSIGAGYGIVSWIKDLVNKSQAKTRKEERTHTTTQVIKQEQSADESKTKAYKEKCQADAFV